MPSPMGVMDISTPRVNRPIPPTSRMAPNRNRTRVPGARGAMVMDNKKTMAVMGKTAAMDSRVFSRSCLFRCKIVSFLQWAGAVRTGPLQISLDSLVPPGRENPKNFRGPGARSDWIYPMNSITGIEYPCQMNGEVLMKS